MRDILDVVSKLREADPPLEYLRDNEDVAVGKFLEFETGFWNGKPRVVPSEALNLPGRPGDRSFLYRGQTAHYATCVASLLRDASENEWQIKALLSLERFKVAELELLLRNHPFNKVAERHGLWVDYHALAQHYGIRTSLLDLTSNIEIAAFFAVAHWNEAIGKFTPMETGTGVLFRFDWSAIGPGYSKFFDPVGFGPGLRPARQHAWTFRLPPGVDFQSIPQVTVFEFSHSKLASEELFDRFKRGKWVYPPDCLASLVEKLRDLPFVTMKALRHAAQQDGQPPEQIDAAAKKAARFLAATLGIEVIDDYELQPEKADIILAEKQATALDDALRGMRRSFRLVRTLRTPPAPTDKPPTTQP